MDERAEPPPTPRRRPLRLVTFDLYDTLIELDPPRWQRLATACVTLGIDADPAILRETDRIAEDFYTEENTLRPIRGRTPEERERFRLVYMARWLDAAGIPHDERTLHALRRAYRAEYEADRGAGGRYRAFDDVLPALARLRAADVLTAVISNADDDVTAICVRFAFAPQIDLIVTSALVGWEKPDARTFRAALDPLGIDPADALHVGDQPRSDIAGALATGMRAVLIDRYDRQPAASVPKVANLHDLASLALAAEGADDDRC